jgi:hypothetical protein
MAVRKKNADGIDIYPLDIEALEKGDHIPRHDPDLPENLRQALQLRRGR